MTPTLIRRCAAVLAGLLFSAVAAGAHHSFDAEYDSSKPLTLNGVVTKLDWINPHAYVFVDVKNAAGTVKNYKVEMGPPYALVRGGWKRDTLKVGDAVTINGAAAAKNGSDAAGSMQSTFMMLGPQKLVMR